MKRMLWCQPLSCLPWIKSWWTLSVKQIPRIELQCIAQCWPIISESPRERSNIKDIFPSLIAVNASITKETWYNVEGSQSYLTSFLSQSSNIAIYYLFSIWDAEVMEHFKDCFLEVKLKKPLASVPGLCWEISNARTSWRLNMPIIGRLSSYL